MKKLVLIFLFLLSSCDWEDDSSKRYTNICDDIFNSLQPPIILVAKSTTKGNEAITVADAKGTLISFDHYCAIAVTIATSKNVGDILKQ